MADLARYPKSVDDWTQNDLDAYNIRLLLEDAATFFELAQSQPSTVDKELTTVLEADDMLLDRNAELINLLDIAMSPADTERGAVVDFVVELFKRLGYVKRHKIARTGVRLPCLVAGEWRDGMADVCLVDRVENLIRLVVQVDKRSESGEPNDARSQLIAKAIAAFTYNNHRREAVGSKPINYEAIPGIIMTGTTPTFYVVPVTAGLAYNVRHGTYPVEPTVVSIHVPTLPRPHRRYDEGMKPLDNRQAILRSYEAFKRVMSA